MKDYYYSVVEYVTYYYPKGLEDYKFCRIELRPGGYESHIWLHPGVDKQRLEALLNGELPDETT